MTIRFTPLASGSRGNACYVQADGAGVLLDAGLGAKDLFQRFADAGHSPAGVQGVLLTHPHTDHWNAPTFAWLHRRNVPLYCHPSHHAALGRYSRAFVKLLA